MPSGFDGDFFGIVSGTAIASIRLDEGTQSAGGFEAFDMDNARLVFGNAAAVPEPATLALLGAALVGAGAMARRRRAL